MSVSTQKQSLYMIASNVTLVSLLPMPQLAKLLGPQGEMESRALASVVNLMDVSGLLSLFEVMKHRVTEECLTLFNVNGTLKKASFSRS